MKKNTGAAKASKRGWRAHLKAVARRVSFLRYWRRHHQGTPATGGFATFRRHQAEGREWAYMRKAIRAAKNGGGPEKARLRRLREARGFRVVKHAER